MKDAANQPGRIGLMIAGCGLVLAATVWIASQGGFAPVAPAGLAALAVIVIKSLPVLGTMWLGAAGLGWPLRRVWMPAAACPVIAQLGLGMAALLLLNWLLSWTVGFHGLTAWGLCGIGIAMLAAQAGVHRRWLQSWDVSQTRLPWTLMLVMVGAALLGVAAVCPPGTLWRVEAFGYDVLSYHLQLPREWLAMGRMQGLEHNVYGYLPNLIEAAYGQIAVMRGSVLDAVYPCQLFHVSLALLAAAAIAAAVRRDARPSTAIAAAAVFLAVPWVMITGSLAYDEMGMMASAAVAFALLLDPGEGGWRKGAAVGFLLGAATLAKLPAGPLLAVPMGMIVLTGWHRASRARRHAPGPQPAEGNEPVPRLVGGRIPRRLTEAGAAAGVGLLVLCPYFIRNTIWTGNPVFPFATEVFGNAHWTPAQAHRWAQAHGLEPGEGSRPGALTRQWLLNTGYGAVGGSPAPRETRNIARFTTEGGLPVLWLATLAAAGLALRDGQTRRLTAACGMMLAVQIGFWLLATHMQSRFLIPTLLPTCVLIGVGIGRLEDIASKAGRWAAGVASAGLVLVLGGVSGTVLANQTRRLPRENGQWAHVPPAVLIDSLARPASGRPGIVGEHLINRLPPGSRIYLVADVSQLLYIRRPIVYHSAFDASPLGALIRRHPHQPAAVTRDLRERGITHVWVHWSELERLHETYGYDPAVTRPALRAMIGTGWRPIERIGNVATLYALPRTPRTNGS